jgi:hypothetical protein
MANETCTVCSGKGKVRCQGCLDDQETGEESTRWAACASCHGSKKVPCTKCKGTGKNP